MGVYSQEKLEHDQVGLNPRYARTLRTAGGGGGELRPDLVAPPDTDTLALMATEEADSKIWEALAINADMVGSEVCNRMLAFLMRLDKRLLSRIIIKPELLKKGP